MNTQEFVNNIKKAVVDVSNQSVHSTLIDPPGRQPSQRLTELSNWFNKLTYDDKEMVLKIIKEATDTSVFGFLCVLDGVRAIDYGPKKGTLTLYYEKDGKQELLNNPQEEYLHDLFNS